MAILAFLAAFDPVRLGVVLLLISRPRPVQNLLAYAVGSLTACSYMLVLPLAVLNTTPIGVQTHANASCTFRHVQIGAGVAALVLAALTTMRPLVRSNAVAARPTSLNTQGEPPSRQLFRRARSVWESGALWVALVIGIAIGGPPWDAVAFLLASIAMSGAAIGAQVVAGIALVVGMLAVVEIALIGHLVNPDKAQGMLRRLRDWASTHRRHALAAISGLAGVSLIANGTGIVGIVGG
ncbi:GAP family protein [Mycobacterium sp. 94-17]|uniref:GAP family protein n=1 Tax=Mycobacterium sp. 94-17 TaxID=2986147 RepID=UPI002D1EE164|nr:GAP family protein [Mycobacterium sp. 94-17]MEB4212025.1 GAP family protein [Mycobacterium sp. 94-17]